MLTASVRRRDLFIRIVYALCLSGAAVNHVRAVLTHGWFPEKVAPITALFWGSLTVLDPVTVVLLFLRPRAGVALTAIIIVSDVAHNLWFIGTRPLHGRFVDDVTSSAFMISQTAFLSFVAATSPVALRATRQAVPPG